ncbi:sensor histidine kinase [Anaerosporobacter faecicola]|uniref:sensor histidine kinase n=1 Tax=Anaerosporobacter faecicola TaxID=2718714 RepID=UPI00143B1FD1|nr:HAMP domain-containing sensor histidine kinase [Anaerosporobacter faecicola]
MYNDKTTGILYQLCKQNKEFDEAIKQMESQHQFVVSQITHEIRNPLTLISSTIQLLESHYPEIAESNLWEQLTDDVSDLVLLLDDVTAYNHSTKLNLQTCDLNHMLQKLIQGFQIHTSSRNITIEMIATEDTKHKLVTFLCDPIKLKQAFTNIIKNAVEAMDESGVIQIHISNELLSMNNEQSSTEYITISFKNNGEPINLDDTLNIFEPFVTYKPNGTGMGLAVTQQIIHAHEGYIKLLLDENWTEFKIFLPNR